MCSTAQTKRKESRHANRLCYWILILSATGTWQTHQHQATEQAILQLTRDWLAAEEKHDRPSLQRIIADDFEGTAPMGNTVFKDDVLPAEGSTRGLAITKSEMKARIFGETAIVTAKGAQKSGGGNASQIHSNLCQAR